MSAVKSRVFPALMILGATLALLTFTSQEAQATCTEVSCDGDYGGSQLDGVQNIEFRDDGTVESWECHYGDGTILVTHCIRQE